MDKLIAELEAAPEGSRKLDKAIYVALGLPITNHRNLDPQMIEIHLESVAPHYTTSLDAALALIPEGSYVKITIGRDKKTWVWVECAENEAVAYGNPALALCIAALRARQAMEAA